MLNDVHVLLDDRLLRRLESESARRGKDVNEVLEEALELYLDQTQAVAEGSVVAKSWGALPIDKELVKEVLEEDDFLGA